MAIPGINLQGKVALVTGASAGIGRAIAQRFARERVRVAVNYRNSRAAAEQLVHEISAEGGVAIAVAADVSIDSEVRNMIDRVQSEFGRLDALINNAGWSTIVPHDHFEDLTDEIWNRTFETNLHAVFYCVRAAVPLLRLQQGAAIVNVASVAGSTGVGSSMAYAAAKGGVLTMTKSLARALAPQIRVNAISPGLIRTNFAGRFRSDSVFVSEESITPLKHLATAEECADLALFLAFAAPAVTGQNIRVDSGLYVLGPNRH